MARGKTFAQLIEALRDEIYLASSPALSKNIESALRRTLSRQYERLWDEHPWPHLRIYRDKPMQAGERYYSFFPELLFEDIEKVVFQEVGTETWHPIRYGISSEDYESDDSDSGQRSDPVYSWVAYEDDQFEVWPIPESSGGKFRAYGRKTFVAPVQETDVIDLDDQMIVLFAAAEWLEKQKSPDAQMKLQQAVSRFDRMKAKQSKNGVWPIQASSDRGSSGPTTRVRAPRR
jgi:hypothetical protein